MNVKDIFLQAIEISDTARRREFVLENCQGDRALGRRVQALLAAHDDPESFLEQPAAKLDIAETREQGSKTLLDSSASSHGRFLPGTRVAERYRIVSLLGRGGMGEVYRADDTRLNQAVALKFLPREMSQDPKRLEYFHNEVRLARQISHPNICRVHDIGEVDGQYFISMEYIDGEDLKTLLRRIGRVSGDKGAELAQQLCSGLAAAHAKGVLHRDLKPANIMIDGRGQIRITDFGLATGNVQGENTVGMSGTPAYMAPEQLLRGHTSVQSDIYSLGLVLFELFTGKPAHSAKNLDELRHLHRMSAPLSFSQISSDVDPVALHAIRRCLEFEPQDRPSSAGELSNALPGGTPLEAALAAGQTPAPELVAASGSSLTISVSRAGWMLAGIALGLVLIGFVGDRTQSVSREANVLPPILLRFEADRLLRNIGYEAPDERDAVAYGFDTIAAQQSNARRRQHDSTWPLLSFWYRESHAEFHTDSHGIRTAGAARVDFDYPRMDMSGMRRLRLSPTGRLLEMQVFTTDSDHAFVKQTLTREELNTQWQAWLPSEIIGVSFCDLDLHETTVVPSVPCDEVHAWTGLWPDSDRPVKFVTATLQGKPVFFQVADTQPRNDQKPKSLAGLIIVTLVISVLNIVSFALVALNLYQGRWDRVGAWRMLAVFCVLGFLSRLCLAHHVDSAWERGVVLVCLSAAVGASLELWIYYVSFEPVIRRYSPELLVTWSRIVTGKWRDPRVGSDLMYGVAYGAIYMLVADLPLLWLNDLNRSTAPEALLSASQMIGQMFGDLSISTLAAFVFTFIFTVGRQLTRSAIPGGVFAVLLGTFWLATSIEYPLSVWGFPLLATVTLLIVLLRHGLLATTIALATGRLLTLPITLHTDRFWFGNSLALVAIILAVASLGAAMATGVFLRRYPSAA